jgi:hypothetical protein
MNSVDLVYDQQSAEIKSAESSSQNDFNSAFAVEDSRSMHSAV